MCECICGNKKYFEAYGLKRGRFNSCGCLRYKRNPDSIYKHRLYNIYNNMIARCQNKNHKSYKHYGQRGISICDQWAIKKEGYINFYNWSIDNGYKDELTIDRIDTNGNYEPDNCKWSTWEEQENNRTNNCLITINGITKNVMQWANEYNLPNETIWSRMKRGKSGEDLIKPSRKMHSKTK